MTEPRRSSPTLEQRTGFLFVSAIAVAIALLALVPLPSAGITRALAMAGVVAGDGAFFAWLWRRQYRAEVAQAKAEVARISEELIAAEKLAGLGRVAAGMAHEVGNPLAGIANYSHVLLSQAGHSQEAETAFAGIEREIERIERIVQGTLDYARPPAQRSAAPFDAATALRNAVHLLSAQGVFRSVHVNSPIDETPLSLVGHPHEFEQAFVNILLNAIDAMDARGTLCLYAGRMTPDAVLRSPRRSGDAANASKERSVNERLAEWRAVRKPDAPCAKFVIADSGPGIDSAESNRVFEPFYSTKSRSTGAGLGLAIVQRVVEAHDGVVWIQRAREGGAAFHLVLPIDQAMQNQGSTMVA